MSSRRLTTTLASMMLQQNGLFVALWKATMVQSSHTV